MAFDVSEYYKARYLQMINESKSYISELLYDVVLDEDGTLPAADYEAAADKMINPTFMGKMGNMISGAGSATKAGAGKAWGWVKEHPWKTAGAGTALGGLAYGAYKGIGWGIDKYNQSQLNDAINDITSMNANEPGYADKISAAADSLFAGNSSAANEKIIEVIKQSGVLENENIKAVLAKSGVELSNILPEEYVNNLNDNDKGFLASMGDKGNQLYDFLTSGSTAGNITAGVLAAAGLAGIYYLYRKWKGSGNVTAEDKKLADRIDAESTEKLAEAYSRYYQW